MKWEGKILILVVTGAIFLPSTGQAVSRFNRVLDGGSVSVTIDNASSIPDSTVGSLVLTADRSTQEDCCYSTPDHKGLMNNSDRVCVTDYYIAWFDYSITDGITFNNPPYWINWGRAGALAGFWSLDPDTNNFRYTRTGPNNCPTWARNELVPGSASPNQEQHWWDKYAPPADQVFTIPVGASYYLFGFHYAQRTSNSLFTMLLDGVEDADGVHYKNSARMTSWNNNVDVTDDNDGNGISNYVDAEMEYICQPKLIRCIWKLKPKYANVISSNMFAYLWTTYAQDVDNYAGCDPGGSGSQWPSTVYGQPMYNRSSHELRMSFGPSVPAGDIVEMQLGYPIPMRPIHHKQSLSILKCWFRESLTAITTWIRRISGTYKNASPATAHHIQVTAAMQTLTSTATSI